MEKKENAATAHPVGVCQKLYNAIINRPFLIPRRRLRLTSGANSHAAEGHNHSDSISSSPPVAAKDNQHKTAAAAAVTLPNAVPPPQKEKLATKPPEAETPHLRQAIIPEKQNVARSAPPTAPEKTGRAPTSVLTLVTENGKAAAPAVPAPSPPPPAAVQGKAAPPPAAPPTASVVQVKAPSPVAPPTGPPVQVKAQAKAPPPAGPPTAPATPPAVDAAAQGKSGVADKPAPVAEKGKAAAPMRAITNMNEKSENFISRARNSWRTSSAVGGTRKES